MYNEPRHLVSIFKDFLIFDDFSEYLKREYQLKESKDRLPKVFDFYSQYSKLFPTYVGLGAHECKYMFKNIEKKQKIIDEQNQPVSEREAGNTVMLFNTQFVNELNNVSQESKTLKQETFTGQGQLLALQYLKNLKGQTPKISNLESMLQVLSRYMDESKALASRIDTQFSEITQQQKGNFDVTMQSFLFEYEANDEQERLHTNCSEEKTSSRVSKALTKSTISQSKAKAKKVLKTQPSVKTTAIKPTSQSQIKMLKPTTLTKPKLMPDPAKVHRPSQKQTIIPNPKQLKEALKAEPERQMASQSIYNVKGPKVTNQISNMLAQPSILTEAVKLSKRSTSNLSSGSGSSGSSFGLSIKSAGVTYPLSASKNPYGKLGARHKLQAEIVSKKIQTKTKTSNLSSSSLHNVPSGSIQKVSQRVTTPTTSSKPSIQLAPATKTLPKKTTTKPLSIFSSGLNVKK